MARVLSLRFWLVSLFMTVVAMAGAKSEIIFWGQSYGPDSKGFEATIREFERRNPEYKVRVVKMGAGEMNPQKLMTAIVGNVPPDIINQDRFTISDWAKRGAFMPLDDLMKRDTGVDPLTPDPSKYVPATIQEATFEGKLYGIPFSCDTRILYYNRKVFREEAANLRKAGLDPDRPPRTWSEVLKYSKVLTKFDKSGRLIRAGWLPNWGNSWLYLFAFQNNASFISPDGRRCTMDTPEAVEALQFMEDGYDIVGGYENAQKYQASFLSNENDPFFRDQIAMKVDGDWTLPNFLRYAPSLDFGVGPPPVPDDRYHHAGRFQNEKDTFITWAGGFCWAIPHGARNVEGAWKLVKWLASTDARVLEFTAQADWEKRRGREFVPRIIGNMEANRKAFDLLKPHNSNVAAALKLHIDLAEVAKIRPVTFVGQPLWDEHVKAIEKACLNVMTPQEALQDGQKRVQQNLNEYYDREKYPIINELIPVYAAIIVAILGAAALVIHYRRQKLGRLARTEALWGYLLISPWLIGFVVFLLGPMVASLFYSFTEYDVMSPARWVGIKNYQALGELDKDLILKSLFNVLYLGGIGVPLGIISGLAVAMLLNTGVKGMRVYRTLFYMPAIVPGMAATILWLYILSPGPDKGIINSFWVQTITPTFGVQPPGWISVAPWAKPSLLLMGLWGAGSGMILWLAGLKGVSRTLYEAAEIDGARPWRQFLSITLPQLSPLILFSTVMGFIGAIQEFDRVYVIQSANGGSNDSVLTPVFHLFTNGFNYFKMGYASALAWLIFAIVLVFTLGQLWLSKKWVYNEVER